MSGMPSAISLRTILLMKSLPIIYYFSIYICFQQHTATSSLHVSTHQILPPPAVSYRDSTIDIQPSTLTMKLLKCNFSTPAGMVFQVPYAYPCERIAYETHTRGLGCSSSAEVSRGTDDIFRRTEMLSLATVCRGSREKFRCSFLLVCIKF
jgi:hypothetical protein